MAVITKTEILFKKALKLRHNISISGVIVQRQAHYIPTETPDANLAKFKRGTGGRSSFSGLVVTVFGCTGRQGLGVVNRLAKVGTQVVCPYRCDPYVARPLKLCGDLGQILFLPFHLKDEESIAKSMRHSDVVINLIGREYETRNFSYYETHEHGPRRIARLARQAGVSRLIHMSAINAKLEPDRIYFKNGSDYLKSKARGELAVREEFPEAVIMRPCDLFGGWDNFFKYYGSKYRHHIGKTMAFYKGGMETYKQPLYYGDSAAAIVSAALDNSCDGKTYQLAGEHRFRMYDLLQYFHEIMRYKRNTLVPATPWWWFKLRFMEENRYFTPNWSRDKYERECLSDDLTEDAYNIHDLGIKDLVDVRHRALKDLVLYRKRAYQKDVLNTYERPDFPQPQPALVW